MQDIHTETPLAERFEAAFNRIHKCLMKLVRNARSDSFKVLLDSGNSHAIIRTHRHDLYQYAKLRNALVHEKIKERYYIAEPNVDVVTHIEMIADRFEQPVTVLSIASSPVLYYKEETPLMDIMKVVDKLSISIFPIYDASGAFKGLLTSEGIIRWLSKQPSSTISIEKVRVRDLMVHEKPHEVVFVKKEADIFEVEEIFEDTFLAQKKLEAVIITENGKATEKLLGIITSWDLVEINTLEQ
ncbi:CBS domain-containing protein [Bacillus sp. SORGH_AS 510]|uniref:CBS domain-containing protein n=1 Tax=Bacillus sp. SORGH_AS_0510 TaxID=3041771 RepID=UPI00278859CD|nr:CBS domain-containing protein [Bacillus sp. SORGH_AS_0510]MDQ1144254.1 CBS domain-containing protein [Bacillus sp. SORGH_AS_0510]